MNEDTRQFQELMETYITRVMQELELETATDEQKALIRELIVQKIDRKIVTLIIDELPDQDFEELITKLQEKSLSEDEEMGLFSEASEKIPDFNDKFIQALDELRIEMIEDSKSLKKALEDADNS